MCKWTSGSKGEVREKESLVVGDGVRGRRGQGNGLDPRIRHGDMALSFFLFFVIVCFISYLMFRIAVLPHSPGVVYYHLLLRRETRIPSVAPFSFRIGIWDLFVQRGQKSYTPTAFGKLWTTRGVRSIIHASS